MKYVENLFSIILLFIILLFSVKCRDSEKNLCDLESGSINERTLNKYFYLQAIPQARAKAGIYMKEPEATDIIQCINKCCSINTCDTVWYHNKTCYRINCYSTDSCLPEDKYDNNIYGETILVNMKRNTNKRDRDCEYGVIETCNKNEKCYVRNKNRRNGICVCNDGYVRNRVSKICEKYDETNKVTEFSLFEDGETTTAHQKTEAKLDLTHSSQKIFTTFTSLETTTSKVTESKIIVSAGDPQVIQLPKSETIISAYALPNQKDYVYSWSVIEKPQEAIAATMDGLDTSQLKIKDLTSGFYLFKIRVSSPDGRYGEAFVNVTVLPISKEKFGVEGETELKAIIRPDSQNVQHPNDVVLDGSESKGSIKTYEWSQVSGPLQTQEDKSIVRKDQSVLRLASPTPGDYVFKLTIYSANGKSSTAKANVTVIRETDYPPVANAGTNLIVSMPVESLTLHGNSSTDDHGIAFYEWTKKSGGSVDMVGTKTEHLTLTKLSAGDYTFTLKVTDSSGQSNEAEIHVIVKPQKNLPPVALAGKDTFVRLPTTSVALDATDSTDDQAIINYKWTQISGKTATLENADRAVATASDLTIGVYEFQVQIEDAEGLTSTDSIKVTVTKLDNDPPVARLPSSLEVNLPVTMVEIDGRKSSDDKGIDKWLWTRTENSLAAGQILNKSETSSVLLLGNLFVGKYEFKLTVTDIEGQQSSAETVLIVKPNKHSNDELFVVVDINLYSLTVGQKNQLEREIALLVKPKSGESPLVSIEKISATDEGHLEARFFIQTLSGEIYPGAPTAELLRRAYLNGRGALLDWKILNLDTVVCQNNCSGHGSCDLATRRCICEAFWVHNLFRRPQLGRYMADCDWSVLYVVVVSVALTIFLTAIIWTVICLCRRKRNVIVSVLKKRKRSSPMKYELLKTDDVQFELSGKNKKGKDGLQNSSVMVSESDIGSTDGEDTLFVSKKSKSNGKLANGHATSGHPRRVKT